MDRGKRTTERERVKQRQAAEHDIDVHALRANKQIKRREGISSLTLSFREQQVGGFGAAQQFFSVTAFYEFAQTRVTKGARHQ